MRARFRKRDDVRRDFDPMVVLAEPLIAHLATGSTDGPRDSPVWFHWEEEAIWLIATSRDSFPKRLRIEPRCAIGVVDFDIERGVLRHVGVRGADADAWNAWLIDRVVEPLDLMIRATPRSMVAKDVSFFRTGPDLAK
jgi:hypothetical protein